MDYAYKGKPILPTKAVLDELSEIGLGLYEIPEILENGFGLKKGKKNFIERGIQRGNKVINIVVVEMDNYYKLIHAGEFSLTRKFKKMLRDKNAI